MKYIFLILLLVCISRITLSQNLSANRVWQLGRSSGINALLWNNDTIHAIGTIGDNNFRYTSLNKTGAYYHHYRFNARLDSISFNQDPQYYGRIFGLKKFNDQILSLNLAIDTSTFRDSLGIVYYSKRGIPIGYAPLDTFLMTYRAQEALSYKSFETHQDGSIFVTGIASQAAPRRWDVFVAHFFSDGRLDWAKVYDRPDNQEPIAIERDTAGGVLVTAVETYGTLYAMSIDVLGNVRGEVSFLPRRTQRILYGAVKRLPSFGYACIFYGDSSLVFVADDAGNTLWKRGSRVGYSPQSLKVFDDGTLAYYREYARGVGVTPYCDTLYKADAYTGRILWKTATTILGAPACIPYQFTYSPWGDAYFGGVCYRNFQNQANSWICKVDNLGRIYDPSAVKGGGWVARGSQLDVGPNPANTSFSIYNLVAGKSYTLHIYDLIGRLVQTKTVLLGEPISVLHLPKGIYQLAIDGRTARLVVE
jgi:hypothetical protein